MYGSDNASLYRRFGADCKSGCLRWFNLPRLSISPNCVDTIWRNVFSRNRFRISPNRLHLCLLPDLHAVPEREDHAALSVYGGPFHQRVPELWREIGDGRFGGFQRFQKASHGAALYLAPVALCLYALQPVFQLCKPLRHCLVLALIRTLFNAASGIAVDERTNALRDACHLIGQYPKQRTKEKSGLLL